LDAYFIAGVNLNSLPCVVARRFSAAILPVKGRKAIMTEDLTVGKPSLSGQFSRQGGAVRIVTTICVFGVDGVLQMPRWPSIETDNPMWPLVRNPTEL
jgi:hypothetical protein